MKLIPKRKLTTKCNYNRDTKTMQVKFKDKMYISSFIYSSSSSPTTPEESASIILLILPSIIIGILDQDCLIR